MQPEFLILGGLLCAVLILQLVALLRRSGHGDLEQSLREEARTGRSELREQLEGLGRQQDARLETFARALTDLSTRTDQRLDLLRDALGEDARKAREDAGQAQQRSDAHMAALRQAVADDARLGREEATQSQHRFGESLGLRLQEMTQRNEQRMGEMRATLEQQLRSLQADNAQKLDQMRVTVDEKLQTTLEARLGASFQLVSDRLEQVQRGLGEMQQLATGVGDLKRVLTNVKNRGSWGEVQLDNILEQTLTQEQYARGVKVRPDSGEMVDIAVRLPGRGHEDTPVWLPIDSKFPREDYERLLDAQEQGDADGVRVQGAQLERAIRIQAKSICDKYIVPPHTTDFAVMFLPTEGLYAEVIRRPGLVDLLQREHRVVVAGPTTVTALLNSLQMGFRTLAIEQRSSEVWSLLGAVKSEFGKFAGILEKAEKQISTVGRSLGEASRKTRTIERRLRGVESLGSEQTDLLLGDASGDDDEASADDASAAQD
ncbi:DNA recombination protein RmuC [Stenotrophomonas rhizophila]|uniref:DNA recombination protein RmuC n=1 Tax=Stenotrophomonas rhizophila TaxID=216778 RepID=A0AAP5EC38_9GAMM|nr:DNA recombination protein RmuC [Stenotrophomonas rhizophila]MDQ1110525.1 DNA recombination protein RmuC [Stenotrophomonas rhizophila]